jgi:hypothetical protein
MADDLPRLSRRQLLDLDAMPSPDARAGRMAGEIRNTPTTWRDYGRMGEGFARDIVTAAPTAIYEAAKDPTLPKITNAGAQTALALGKPIQALGIGGLGLAGAVANDLDLFGGDAVAGSKSKKAEAPAIAPPPDIPGLSPEEQAVFNSAWAQMNAPIGSIPKVARQSAKDTVDRFMSNLGEKSAAAARQKQQEYENKVGDAERAKDRELARDVRFADTDVGKWYKENATWLPFAAAFGGGLASRAFTGPGKELAGKAFKEYGLPIFTGATLSYGAQNAPEIYDFSVPPALNPEKEAYSKYAFKLPDGHPDKDKAKSYADELPRINPVKTAAVESFKENAPARMMAAGLEGISLGKLGAGAAGLPGRLVNDGVEKAKAASGRGGGPTTSPVTAPAPVLPAPPAGNGRFQSQYSGDYSSYPKLPAEVRGGLRGGYADDVSLNASLPPAKVSAEDLTKMLKGMGINVTVPQNRINAINKLVRQFKQANGRDPSRDEIMGLFNDKTLGIGALGLGAGALGAGAMDQPPEQFANGGAVLPRIGANGEPVTVGALMSDVPGRTDHLNISVPEGSYVIPADLISAMGEGNTLAGMKRVQEMFPAPQMNRANGGKVPIAAAGGEYVIPPETVAAIGGGNLDKGHSILDDWVVNTRKQTIQHLARIPRPER